MTSDHSSRDNSLKKTKKKNNEKETYLHPIKQVKIQEKK